MRRSLALAVSAMCLAAPVLAQSAAPDYVTDPAMCDQPEGAYLGEMGMVLGADYMEEIEYFCAFEPPIVFDWSEDRVQSRVGYCNEPGFILPTVFAFVTGPSEPGLVEVWEQGSDAPTRFQACR